MATQAETGIVVAAFIVGLPEIQQGPSVWFARAGEHEANQFDWVPRHAFFKQFSPLGRERLEERPFGLPQGCFVAVVACGRGGKRSLSKISIDRQERTGCEGSHSQYSASRRRVDHARPRQFIVSNSSIMPAITESPPSQNLGSFASSPNGL